MRELWIAAIHDRHDPLVIAAIYDAPVRYLTTRVLFYEIHIVGTFVLWMKC